MTKQSFTLTEQKKYSVLRIIIIIFISFTIDILFQAFKK